MVLRHGFELTQHRTGTGGHDNPEQRTQALFQAHLLVVLTLRRTHPYSHLFERRQTLEILDYPVQIDSRRAMTEIVLAQWAVAALLVFKTRPGLCALRSLCLVHPVQLDPIAELMIVVESD